MARGELKESTATWVEHWVRASAGGVVMEVWGLARSAGVKVAHQHHRFRVTGEQVEEGVQVNQGVSLRGLESGLLEPVAVWCRERGDVGGYKVQPLPSPGHRGSYRCGRGLLPHDSGIGVDQEGHALVGVLVGRRQVHLLEAMGCTQQGVLAPGLGQAERQYGAPVGALVYQEAF